MELSIALKYSKKGIPYIDLDKYGVLIFSRLTADQDLGYKWMAYNWSHVETVRLKNTAGARFEILATNRESHVFNMNFKRDMANQWGVPRGTIPPKIVKEFRNIFASLVENEIYMPFNNIEILKTILEDTDFGKLITPAPKKIRKKRKKKEKK